MIEPNKRRDGSIGRPTRAETIAGPPGRERRRERVDEEQPNEAATNEELGIGGQAGPERSHDDIGDRYTAEDGETLRTDPRI